MLPARIKSCTTALLFALLSVVACSGAPGTPPPFPATATAVPASVVAQAVVKPVKTSLTPGTTRLKSASTYTKYTAQYGTNPAATWDAYVPNNGQAQNPTLIWFPGGAWNSGDRTSCPDALEQGMAKDGWTFICAGYRLSGTAPHPAAIQDARNAVRTARIAAKVWPDKIAVGGTSAGGELALLLGTAADAHHPDWDIGSNLSQSSAVQAVAADMPPTDLAAWPTDPCCTAWNLGAPDSFLSAYLGGPVLDDPARAANASPITYVNGDEPPTFLWVGTSDNSVGTGQVEAMWDRLRQFGRTGGIHIQQDMGHDSTWITPARVAELSAELDGVIR